MTETMEAVARLKREHHAVIAAHTYQSPEVQACADILGDSFALAQKAAATDADTVFLCGVRFMAEGIKILSPGKRVVLVEPTADCPMARQIEPERVAAFRQEHPDYAVVAYINEHYNESLTLDLLAEKFFISKYHLLRKFDAQVGTTVHRYILQKRLLIAKQLLAGGVAPNEACGYCGFGDYANFYRAFRAEYGTTPRQYTQSIRAQG